MVLFPGLRHPGPPMIVTCVSCQTRFRIPDEKVGPAGAKLRCGRCRAVFVVHRQAPVDALPRATPPPLPPPRRTPPAAPLPEPPDPLAPWLDLDLTGPAPGVRADDPFAPKAAPGDPFAAADPFAAPAPTAGPRPPDPFLIPAVPYPAVEPDPFSLGAATPAPAGAAPGGVPTPLPGAHAIALEEAEQRARTPAGNTAFDSLEADQASPADFRTPGPSGLEVAEEPAPPPAREAAPPARAPPRQAAELPPPAPEPTPAVAPPHQRLLAVLVNSLSLALLLALAGAIFITWKGGGPSALWATLGAGAREEPLLVREVHTGLYDTAAGRPVLFVRGRVLARGGAAGRVRVRVELVDAGRTLAQGEGLCGALPSPEEVWALEGPADVDGLRTALAARAAPRMAPGEVQPFLVVLGSVPSELRRLDLKVVAEPVPPS